MSNLEIQSTQIRDSIARAMPETESMDLVGLSLRPAITAEILNSMVRLKAAISQSIRKEGAWINCILSIKMPKITTLQAFGPKSIIVSPKQMMFWKK